jgi:hypothetical protein
MWKGQESLLKAIVDQTQSISAIQGGVYCVVYSSSSIRAQSLDTTGAAGMVDLLQNGKSWFKKNRSQLWSTNESAKVFSNRLCTRIL